VKVVSTYKKVTATKVLVHELLTSHGHTAIAVTFDRISATEYQLHGTVHSGGKTIPSIDTCTRNTH
jgi:hypothetical protein